MLVDINKNAAVTELLAKDPELELVEYARSVARSNITRDLLSSALYDMARIHLLNDLTFRNTQYLCIELLLNLVDFDAIARDVMDGML